jgi:tetratricopeptide (TPR) repeat protein
MMALQVACGSQLVLWRLRVVVLVLVAVMAPDVSRAQQAPPAAQQAYAAALRESLRNGMPYARAKQYAAQIGDQVWMQEVEAGRALPPGANSPSRQPQPRRQPPRRPTPSRSIPPQSPQARPAAAGESVGDLSLPDLKRICDQVRARVSPPASSEDQELDVAGSVMDAARGVLNYENAELYWQNSIKPAVLSGENNAVADAMARMRRSDLSALLTMLETSRWGELPAVVDDRSASQWLLQCVESLIGAKTPQRLNGQPPPTIGAQTNETKVLASEITAESLAELASLAKSMIGQVDAPVVDTHGVPPLSDQWKPDREKADSLMNEAWDARDAGNFQRAMELARDASSRDDRLEFSDSDYYVFFAEVLKDIGDASLDKAFDEYDLGRNCEDIGRFGDSLGHYYRALIRSRDCHWAANNVAWLMATKAGATNMEGRDAVPFAMHACVSTKWHYWGFIDTLAACYARAGDFTTAIRCCDRAIDLAPENERPKLREMRALYEACRPYTDPSFDHPRLDMVDTGAAVVGERKSLPASSVPTEAGGRSQEELGVFSPHRYERATLRKVISDPSDYIGKQLVFTDLVVNPDIHRDRERNLGVFRFVGGADAITKPIIMRNELAIVGSIDLCKRLDEPLIHSRKDLYREACLAASAGAIGVQMPDPSQEHTGPAGVSSLYVTVSQTAEGHILAMIDAIEVYSPFPRPNGTRTLIKP